MLPADGWTVIVPVKEFSRAKSRLDLPPTARSRLAKALAERTVGVVTACQRVRRAVIVTGERALVESFAGSATIIEDPSSDAGLNECLRHAIRVCGARSGPTAVLVADLPNLAVEELEEALDEALRHPRSVVADANGTGTVLLASTCVDHLVPAFGDGSLRAHRKAGSVPLAGLWPGLRRDLDVIEDLSHVEGRGT